MVAEQIKAEEGLPAVAGKISLESLSALTGFPRELIKQELFMGSEDAELEGVSLEQLRHAMLSFIDATFLENEKK